MWQTRIMWIHTGMETSLPHGSQIEGFNIAKHIFTDLFILSLDPVCLAIHPRPTYICSTGIGTYVYH